MKKVITYGTFDLFHEGHRALLKRAKTLGDYLIVGVTTQAYDEERGKLNVKQSLMERIENVRQSGYADEVIIEEYEGQKINDIQKYGVDIFTIGSDWNGKFDYLKAYCQVVYLERTRGVSSTKLRSSRDGVVRLGIIGNGRIAERFIKEARYVSGVNVEGVLGRTEEHVRSFAQRNELNFYTTDVSAFFDRVDAVYIATPHAGHYPYAKLSLEAGKHVLCEKPMAMREAQAGELYDLAGRRNCVLLEAVKTAFAPGFIRVVTIAQSGKIGRIKAVEATFTKLAEGDVRELQRKKNGGSVTELISYPLLAAFKLLGCSYKDIEFFTCFDGGKGIDLYTKSILRYENGVADLTVGLGVKSEGELIISGTRGYVYVPAPWWKTEYFEIRFEDAGKNRKYYYKFEGDGLRYELAEFMKLIHQKNESGKAGATYKLTAEESTAMAKVIQAFECGERKVFQ